MKHTNYEHLLKENTDGKVFCKSCEHWREPEWMNESGGCLTCTGYDGKQEPIWFSTNKDIPFTCLGCFDVFFYPRKLKSKPPKYCSMKCFQKHKTFSFRSKNEIHFFNLCKEHFIDVFANPRIFNGLDCDVLIKPLRIAVMWDGIHHRKEIYKGQVLEKTKSRDALRIKLIRKAGYIPYTICDNGAENKKFVESEFRKFLLVYPNLT